jgi:hypothetical protein
VTEQEAAVLDELDAEVMREMEAARPRHERLAVLVDIEVRARFWCCVCEGVLFGSLLGGGVKAWPLNGLETTRF